MSQSCQKGCPLAPRARGCTVARGEFPRVSVHVPSVASQPAAWGSGPFWRDPFFSWKHVEEAEGAYCRYVSFA